MNIHNNKDDEVKDDEYQSPIEFVVSVVFGTFFCIAWLAGLVIAKGGWQTTFALFPPYSFYLVVERILKVYTDLL